MTRCRKNIWYSQFGPALSASHHVWVVSTDFFTIIWNFNQIPCKPSRVMPIESLYEIHKTSYISWTNRVFSNTDSDSPNVLHRPLRPVNHSWNNPYIKYMIFRWKLLPFQALVKTSTRENNWGFKNIHWWDLVHDRMNLVKIIISHLTHSKWTSVSYVSWLFILDKIK